MLTTQFNLMFGCMIVDEVHNNMCSHFSTMYHSTGSVPIKSAVDIKQRFLYFLN